MTINSNRSKTKPAQKSPRLPFIDALRGFAIISMILNHTLRHWYRGPETPLSEALIYFTMIGAAPLFVFLSGYSLTLGRTRRLKRSILMIVIGCVLDQILYPGHYFFVMGPLQAIGLSTLVALPILKALNSKLAPFFFSFVGVSAYLAFAASIETINKLGLASPVWDRINIMLFFDLPVWPWIGLYFLGVTFGLTQPSRQKGGALSLGLLVGGISARALGLWPDFQIDCSEFTTWVPGGASMLWILGFLGAAFYTFETLGQSHRLPQDLVRFGKHPLKIYVSHLFFIVVVMQDGIGFSTTDWVTFWISSITLLAVFTILLRISKSK